MSKNVAGGTMRKVVLNNGVEMPIFRFGVYQIADEENIDLDRRNFIAKTIFGGPRRNKKMNYESTNTGKKRYSGFKKSG
jgi:hypothetical protein